MVDQEILKKKILHVLEKQGFKINPHLRPKGYSKRTYKRIQSHARFEQINCHKKFLCDTIKKAKVYCKDGKEINPRDISLEIRLVKENSLEATLFRWWNFIWWSIPYQRSYGRQMRFMLWDTTHKAPFGLICLQSPVLKMSVRDKSLGLPDNELDIWVNRSMNAQRVGALPPYNELIGGKMVALALTANEIRCCYKAKYENYISVIKKRKLDAELLFITTTSAFGRSSIYNRLKYNGDLVAECLGYTKGSGSFHIPQNIYEEIIEFLSYKGVAVDRGYGHGPSRKLRLISLGLQYLGLPSFEFHGIKRQFYLFSLAKNLKDVIQNNHNPIWIDRPFEELVDYWKERWAIPRSRRNVKWWDFSSKKFFVGVKRTLKKSDAK
jgi:histone H3/H4